MKKSIRISLVIMVLFFIAFFALGSNREEEQVSEVGDSHSDTETNIRLTNNITDLYSVTYLGTHDGVVVLSVSSVAPIGRQNAIEWIEEDAGYDLSSVRIVFPDYSNPFGVVKAGVDHE